jgi:hypothetical protein
VSPSLRLNQPTPPAKGDATHTDGRAIAEWDDQAVLPGGGGQLAGGRPGFDPSDPRRGVDVDGVHRRQVDQCAALGSAIAGQL